MGGGGWGEGRDRVGRVKRQMRRRPKLHREDLEGKAIHYIIQWLPSYR